MSELPNFTPPVIPGRLRRNGTRPSCENCRIAKARCDHNAPCGRCSRTGKTCFFHPNPMSSASRMKRSPNTASDGVSPKNDKAESNRKTRSNSEPAPGSNPPSLHPGIRNYIKRAERLSLGYMGSTSHAAILAESGGHPILDILNDVPEDTPPSSQSGVDETAMKIAMGILAWFPSQQTCERVMGYTAGTKATEGPTCFIQMRVTRYFIKRFWEAFGHLLRIPRRQENLRQIATALVGNTKPPLALPNSNEDFLTSFCGSKSRWEAVGLFFVSFGALLFSIPDSSPIVPEILPKNTDKKSYVCSMLECADTCLTLTEELAFSGNLLFLSLFQSCVQLQSMIAGDSNYELWKRLGRLVAAVMGLGLHLRASPAESQSALYNQTRTRTLTATVSLDKQLSTFVGRPSLLSHRFVSCDLPLDISEDEIMDYSDLSVLQQRVDENGWNIDGVLSISTGLRALAILNSLRDQILELSLTTIDLPDLGNQIETLMDRLEQTYNSFPEALRMSLNKQSFNERTAQEIRVIASTQLYHWHNLFLCERIHKEQRDSTRFLGIAGQILSMVNLYWSERDRYPSCRDVCHWWISCYGIPAASALATDLWKQTMDPMNHPVSQSRPYIIQDLHVFIAALEWIDQSCGNYKLCQRIKDMLSDLIFRILNPNTPNISYDPVADLGSWDSNNMGFSSFPTLEFDDMNAWFNAPPPLVT